MFQRISHITIVAAVAVLALAGSATALSGRAASTIPMCSTGDLNMQLVPGQPGAGQRYVTLELTNRSGHTCHTYGYVGLALLDGRNHAFETHASWDRSVRPHRVVLAPDASAVALLHYTIVWGAGDPTGACAIPPLRVEITAPDNYSHLIIPWNQGAVCNHGRIDVGPLELTQQA
jgi:hypothetical protein